MDYLETGKKKVFVSGCFDMLHSGHIAFFRSAAQYGDLYVALGSDDTILQLKGRLPVNSQDERCFMIEALQDVKEVFVSSGDGMLDFVEEFKAIQPDYMIINADGYTQEKADLCASQGVELLVLEREPYGSFPSRSTTELRTLDQMPYRIDLAGGWLDQPFVSTYHPGPVVTISIEPTINFHNRSGMATSTRHTAIDLWGKKLPAGDPEKKANILFCCDNPPGTKIISGSQDAIGIVFAGLAKANYDGAYWPASIERNLNESALQFVETSLYLVTLGPRGEDYDVLANTDFTVEKAKALAQAAEDCWDAIADKDIARFGTAMRAGFEAQVAMFPNMMNEDVGQLIQKYKNSAYGWKLSGAGGGGYLVLVSDKPVYGASRITARREFE